MYRTDASEGRLLDVENGGVRMHAVGECECTSKRALGCDHGHSAAQGRLQRGPYGCTRASDQHTNLALLPRW
jgi:hypothetical protein